MIIKLRTYTGHATRYVEDARVFYNPDCGKYGVETYGNLWGDACGKRWQQVVLDTKRPYTRYRKVAERWLKQLIQGE